MNSTYLEHHGIKGMRWGIRRYQNKDGSLTPAGKRRLIQIESERDTLLGVKKKSDSTTDSTPVVKKKTAREMSDKELQDKIERYRLESAYIEFEKKLSKEYEEPVSAGKRFVKYVGDKIVIPAATDAAKNFLGKYLASKGDTLLSELNKKAKNSDKKES